MSIALRGKASVAAYNDATITQAMFNVAPQAGDLLVAFVSASIDVSYSLVPPQYTYDFTGWTQILNAYTGFGGGGPVYDWDLDDGTYYYYGNAYKSTAHRKWWNSSDTNYVLHSPDTSTEFAFSILAFSGVDPTTPIDGTPQANSNSLTTYATTASVANDLLLVAGATDNPFNQVLSGPTGMTVDHNIASPSGKVHLLVAEEARAASGSTGTRTVGNSLSPTGAHSMAVLLKPQQAAAAASQGWGIRTS